MLPVNDKNIQKLGKARFGLFIHWGLYAATEGFWGGKETKGIGEWIAAREQIPNDEYEKLADKMTCEKFNASQWAELAYDAGMRYCVFTAKHHEGFAMYDTGYDDYSIVKRSPYGKDIAAEITNAMREKGIIPCFYYSQAIDFHESEAMGNTWYFEKPENERDFLSYINGKCKYQLRELLENYGDIGLVWMDVPKGITKEIAEDLKAHVKKYQPDCLVSGRIGGEWDMGDYFCMGDNQVPVGKADYLRETASTMNDTWGYKREDHNFKSPKEITELLCSLVSKGTNLLLNIGPRANGEIPEESIHILKELAEWMSVNGEAIHESDASPFASEFSFGSCCRKENVLYFFVYDKPDSISVRGIKNKVLSVEILGGGAAEYTDGESLVIRLHKHNKYVTVVKAVLDSEPEIESGLYMQEDSCILLPAYLCGICKTDNILSETAKSGDAAIDAERFNVSADNSIGISEAGIIQNWASEKDYIKWSFECGCGGEYRAYLYTLAQKYTEWKSPGEVYIETERKYEPKILEADRKSRGANKKYFDETGSFIGNISIRNGKNTIYVKADKINAEYGLSVSRLVLEKI